MLTSPAEAWQQILEAVPEALLILGDDGRIVHANARAQATLGRSTAQLDGIELATLVSADDQPHYTDLVARSFAAGPSTGEAAPAIFKLQRSGREAQLEISFGRAQIAQSAMLIGSVRDVSAREQARALQAAALADEKEARARLEILLENAPALIMALNRDGRIWYINWVLPQYSKADVIGSYFLKYIPPARHAMLLAALQSVLASGPPQTYDTSVTGPDGAEIWFASRIGAMHSDGQIVGAVIVSENVTERKRTQLELQSTRHMAVLGTLVAGVAHEINTPIQFVGDSIAFLREATADLLTVIGTIHKLRVSLRSGERTADALAIAVPAVIEAAGEAERAADLPDLRERIPKAFERCAEGLERVATIVRSLKAFAHPSGKEMAAADLNQAIRSTLVIANSEYKYLADVETDLGDIPPVQCHLDELNQVILNVLVNAAHAISDVVKSSGGRGVISVKTRREGEDVVIAIGDTGGGIPENIRGRIFDPFFTTKEIGRGTGQGLAISQTMVVDQHGGQLTFETTLGKGTTFFIRLPIAGKAPAVAA